MARQRKNSKPAEVETDESTQDQSTATPEEDTTEDTVSEVDESVSDSDTETAPADPIVEVTVEKDGEPLEPEPESDDADSKESKKSKDDDVSASKDKPEAKQPEPKEKPPQTKKTPSAQIVSTRPTGLQALRNSTSTKRVTTRATPEQIREIILDKHGINLNSANESQYLRDMATDLDEYAKVMDARSPVSESIILDQQQTLTRRLQDLLNSSVDVGVSGFLIMEEYFRAYSAFSGQHPFRAANLLSPEANKMMLIIFALQHAALNGRSSLANSKEISLDKLKEQCGSADAQVVLLAYLNKN